MQKYGIFCSVRYILSRIPVELGARRRRGAFCPEVSINQGGQNKRQKPKEK